MAREVIKVGGSEINLSISADFGDIQLRFHNLATKLSDLTRFWIEFFAPQFFKDIQENFASEGGFVGGWRALSSKYAAWKLAHYGNRPILVLTGAMRESLRLGGRGNVVIAGKKTGVFGSRDRKLGWHNRGTARMPQRQVIYVKRGTVYQRHLHRFAREEMAAAGIRARA
jgi:hypothetical protein